MISVEGGLGIKYEIGRRKQQEEGREKKKSITKNNCPIRNHLHNQLRPTISLRPSFRLQCSKGMAAQGTVVQGTVVQGTVVQGTVVQGNVVQGTVVQGTVVQGATPVTIHNAKYRGAGEGERERTRARERVRERERTHTAFCVCFESFLSPLNNVSSFLPYQKWPSHFLQAPKSPFPHFGRSSHFRPRRPQSISSINFTSETPHHPTPTLPACLHRDTRTSSSKSPSHTHSTALRNLCPFARCDTQPLIPLPHFPLTIAAAGSENGGGCVAKR